MKKLFICIFILTILDAAATVAGAKLGYIEEANPLIRGLFNAQPSFTAVSICLFTGALLLLLYTLHLRIPWLGYVMIGVLILKSAIVCMHIFFAFTAFV